MRNLLSLAAYVLLGCALLLSPAANGASSAELTLDVTFTPNGTINVTLPDGTPVGSTSGTPSVIPAGYYTLVLLGPGGCTELPYFELKGPGENIQNDMDLGELRTSLTADFQPNATYTWLDDADPDVVYTFETSGQILGTAPTPTPSPAPKTPAGSTESSQDVVGSAATYRGKLMAAVSSTGMITLSFRGARVTRLVQGRYTITVSDKSAHAGFALKRAGGKTLTVTGAAFVGRESRSIELTSGTWRPLGRRPNQALDSFVVRSDH